MRRQQNETWLFWKNRDESFQEETDFHKQDFHENMKHGIQIISFMSKRTFIEIKSLDLRFVTCMKTMMALLHQLKHLIANSSNVCSP